MQLTSYMKIVLRLRNFSRIRHFLDRGDNKQYTFSPPEIRQEPVSDCFNGLHCTRKVFSDWSPRIDACKFFSANQTSNSPCDVSRGLYMCYEACENTAVWCTVCSLSSGKSDFVQGVVRGSQRVISITWNRINVDHFLSVNYGFRSRKATTWINSNPT